MEKKSFAELKESSFKGLQEKIDELFEPITIKKINRDDNFNQYWLTNRLCLRFTYGGGITDELYIDFYLFKSDDFGINNLPYTSKRYIYYNEFYDDLIKFKENELEKYL